jgi:hypothetical protein
VIASLPLRSRKYVGKFSCGHVTPEGLTKRLDTPELKNAQFTATKKSGNKHKLSGVRRVVVNADPAVAPKVKGKAVAVRGREGPQGCDRWRLPHFLDKRLSHGGEVVSLTRRPLFTPQVDSWYSFPLEAESTPRPSAAGAIR